MSQVHTFWVLFIGFMLFLGFYIVDCYLLKWFVWENPYSSKVYGLRILLGLYGLLFAFYAVYFYGYLEGKKNGETKSDRA